MFVWSCLSHIVWLMGHCGDWMVGILNQIVNALIRENFFLFLLSRYIDYRFYFVLFYTYALQEKNLTDINYSPN